MTTFIKRAALVVAATALFAGTVAARTFRWE